MRSEPGMSFKSGNLHFHFIAAGLISLLALFLLADPIPQDQDYHRFADARAWLGIPNFNDVTSNLGFLVVGLLGLRLQASPAWKTLFGGTVLLAFGSAYYHWNPSDATLFWDRLTMTFGFMGLVTALMAEHLDAKLERMLLGPALILGLLSLLVWMLWDDLRLYAWVQFFPMFLAAFLLLRVPAPFSYRNRLWGTLALYATAKAAEAFDSQIFDLLGGAYSGHSLKHWIAAGAIYIVYTMLRDRNR